MGLHFEVGYFMMNYLIINDFQTTFLPMGFVVNEWAKFKFKRQTKYATDVFFLHMFTMFT